MPVKKARKGSVQYGLVVTEESKVGSPMACALD
jgi:hypothetical protein